MRTYKHTNAQSVAEAIRLMSDHAGRAKLLAGGTDLLGLLKTGSQPVFPEIMINIKSIKGLDGIEKNGQGLHIGATTKLAEISRSSVVQETFPILAKAAESVAMPQIRNMGTLGGNLAQETRCWYYRYPNTIGGRIICRRKGEGACLAVKGDNRFHALFGANKCFAVCPSDMAVALAALDGQITIVGPGGERSVPVTEFYHSLGNALASDEIITRISIPQPDPENYQVFLKHRVRESIDFAVVSLAMACTIRDERCVTARIVLGAVAPGPYRAEKAETVLTNKPLTSETAEAVADAAVSGAVLLSGNGYKVELIKALVSRGVAR
jgi:xanthine dehydrogenase YagS FAD-binding subunit